MNLIDLTAVRELIPVPVALRAIGWRHVGQSRGILRGPCPIHLSTYKRSRVFAAGPRFFKCHKCGHGGGVLDLWMLLRKLTVHQAALDLCRTVRMSVPWLPPTFRGGQRRGTVGGPGGLPPGELPSDPSQSRPSEVSNAD